jgi:hypothetical protein
MVGPLKGKFGAYIVFIDNINNPPQKQDFSGERMQQESQFGSRVTGMIYESIKKAGRIKDNRKTFF